jgi:hypothetical protein
MDREQFDALTRFVGTSTSRRAALAALLGTSLLGNPPVQLSAKLLAKRQDNSKEKRNRRRRRGERRCYPGQSCTPGQGQDNSGCDFSRSLAFFERKAQGSDLSRANFTDAQLAAANFQGADLGGACLVGANLLGAVVDGSTNLEGAVFCRTLMPDGSYDDRDCGDVSRCCPAPFNCVGDLCPATCIQSPNIQCSPNVPYGGCCPGLHCVPSSTAPIRFTCQAPCGADGSCRARFGTPWICANEPVICRYLNGQCCQHL